MIGPKLLSKAANRVRFSIKGAFIFMIFFRRENPVFHLGPKLFLEAEVVALLDDCRVYQGVPFARS